MRAKRAVKIITARFALKHSEKRGWIFFSAKKVTIVCTYSIKILNLKKKLLRKNWSQTGSPQPVWLYFWIEGKNHWFNKYVRCMYSIPIKLSKVALLNSSRAKQAVKFFTTSLALVFFLIRCLILAQMCLTFHVKPIKIKIRSENWNFI